MKIPRSILLALVLFSLITLPQFGFTQVRRGRSVGKTPRITRASSREAAYRANNFGVALLEQFSHREGAEEFRRALRLDSRNALARINLAIALYNVPDIEGAVEAARAAIEIAPRAPQTHYILGLIAKNQNRADDAVGELKQVLAIDPDDTGANVLLGQLYLQQRNFKEANAHFRRAVEAEPYNGTALYNLATALLRAGERDEGGRIMARFQELRASGAATIIGQNYLEQGRYAEAVTSTGAEADLVDHATPRVRFVEATPRAFSIARRGEGRGGLIGGRLDESRAAGEQKGGDASALWDRRFAVAASFGGGTTLFDFDSDGDLDLLDLAPKSLRLFRNDRGRFVNVTAGAGLLSQVSESGVNIAAVAGDYDNDGREDLLILRYPGIVLMHNDGGGKFFHTTVSARIPAYHYLARSAAFADVDHDGDLDIFVAGFMDISKANDTPAPGREGMPPGEPNILRQPYPPVPNMLLRNNGDGTFTEAAGSARVSAGGGAFAVVPTDYDNRRDVDLLVARAGASPSLYRNMRDTTFRDVAAEVGLDIGEGATCVAAGDVNKDGFTDFFFGTPSAPGKFVLSDGRGKFRQTDAPALSGLKRSVPLSGCTAAQFLDYDNDGLLDLVTLSWPSARANSELRILRNTGDGWEDVSAVAVESERAIGETRRERSAPPAGLRRSPASSGSSSTSTNPSKPNTTAKPACSVPVAHRARWWRAPPPAVAIPSANA